MLMAGNQSDMIRSGGRAKVQALECFRVEKEQVSCN